MSDIKKELERYARNNYTRKEIIQRLQKDGFDISQINEEMSKEMEASEDRIVMNMLYFFPSVIYILILIVISMLGISKLDSYVGKGACFLALIALVVLTYQYYKEKPNAIFVVSVALFAGLAFVIVALGIRLMYDFKIPFLNYWSIPFIALYTYFFGKENFSLYKDVK